MLCQCDCSAIASLSASLIVFWLPLSEGISFYDSVQALSEGKEARVPLLHAARRLIYSFSQVEGAATVWFREHPLPCPSTIMNKYPLADFWFLISSAKLESLSPCTPSLLRSEKQIPTSHSLLTYCSTSLKTILRIRFDNLKIWSGLPTATQPPTPAVYQS